MLSSLYMLTVMLALSGQTVLPPTDPWPVNKQWTTWSGAPAVAWPTGDYLFRQRYLKDAPR